MVAGILGSNDVRLGRGWPRRWRSSWCCRLRGSRGIASGRDVVAVGPHGLRFGYLRSVATAVFRGLLGFAPGLVLGFAPGGLLACLLLPVSAFGELPANLTSYCPC